MKKRPQDTSAEEPDGGNLHVRNRRGPGLGNRPGLLNIKLKQALPTLGAIVSIFVGISPPARSASPEPEESAKLDEIVVTAQKREESLQTVPISIAVLGGQDLDKSSYQGIAEALNSVAGVVTFPSLQGGGTVMSVRGVVATGALFQGASPIGYYVDGVPFGLVDSAIVPDTNAYDLQRVEVLRGPQGTLYGASALNGVVRILTQSADLNDFNIKLDGSGSSTQGGGDNYAGNMAVNVPLIPGKLAARAVVGYESQSGWIDKPNEGQKDANGAILRNFRLKLNARPTENLTIGISAWSSRQNYGAPNVSNPQGVSTRALSESTATDYGAYGLTVGYSFPTFSITSNTSYLNFQTADTLDLLDVIGVDLALADSLTAHTFAEEINLNSTQIGPWKWSAGLLYRDASNTTIQSIGSPLLDWTDTSKSYAIFAEVSRRFLNDKFEWTLGGRYFHDDVETREDQALAPFNTSTNQYYRAKSTFDRPTPRVVLTWNFADASLLYSSFSEGFRSGARQPYYSVTGAIGFPPVKPDKLYNYEIGAKSDLFERRLSINAAAYYMDWKDVQQTLFVPFGESFVSALVNGNSASGVGVDFGVSARPTNNLELNLNLSWNDLTWGNDQFSNGQRIFKKGDRLVNSAEKSANASAAYIVPIGQSGFEGRIAISGTYSSPLLALGAAGNGGVIATETGNSVTIGRASISIRAPSHWQAALFVDNFSNWQGTTVKVPSYSTNFDTRLRPRTVGVQFSYQPK